MSNLIINCPHCDRPTPVELGKRVTSKQRCKHCKLIVGESDIVVGGRKPVIRKKVNVGGGQFGGERNLDDVTHGDGESSTKKGRFLLSHVVVTLLVVAVGLAGVGRLLYTNYVNKKAAHKILMDRFTAVQQQIEKNDAVDFAPERRHSTMPSVRAIHHAKKNFDALIECETPEQLLKYVRNPDQVSERLLAYYEAGRGSLPIRDWLAIKKDTRIDYDEELKIAIFYVFKDDGEPWWVVFKEGYDLSLMSIDNPEELKSNGRSHVSIALVNGTLNVRVFDADANLVVDKSEDTLVRGQPLQDLKTMLSSMTFPLEAEIPEEQTLKIIQLGTLVTGHTLDEPINDPKLDWESFVRYCEQDVPEFLEEKPHTPKEFRVLAMIDDYFNYKYSDPHKYWCVRLFDPTESFMFYGYVEKNSELGRTVRAQVPSKVVNVKNISVTEGNSAFRLQGLDSVQTDIPGLRKPRSLVTVKLKFPSPLQGDNQVEISEFIRRSWYIP